MMYCRFDEAPHSFCSDQLMLLLLLLFLSLSFSVFSSPAEATTEKVQGGVGEAGDHAT